jgi:hypothetical protein
VIDIPPLSGGMRSARKSTVHELFIGVDVTDLALTVLKV